MILYSHVVEGLMASSIQAITEGDPKGSSNLLLSQDLPISVVLLAPWWDSVWFTLLWHDEWRVKSHSSTNDLTTGMPFNEYDLVVESYTMKEHLSERFVLADSSDPEE